jgi:hypothetical protein
MTPDNNKVHFFINVTKLKKILRKLSLLMMTDVPLPTCQKIVRKNLDFNPYKITLQEFRPGDSERPLECSNWFLNNLNDDRFAMMN